MSFKQNSKDVSGIAPVLELSSSTEKKSFKSSIDRSVVGEEFGMEPQDLFQRNPQA